ncbi:MAG: glutathione S-transferase [Pseudomonadota bacterium]
MYRLIGGARNRGFRVMWMLEELGLDYAVVDAAPGSEEITQLNPLGKLPALVDGDAVLTDSVAIMTYLADKHGQFTAAPGTVDRARQDAMTLWIIDEMDALLWAAAKHSFVLPENMRVKDLKSTLKAEFARNAEILEQRICGAFLMGDALTIPDFLAVHCLGWSRVAGFDALPEAVKAFAKRLRDRPAYRAAAAR